MSTALGVLAHVVVDVLSESGQSKAREYLGGAGMYASLGLRMSSHKRVIVSSGVGADFVDGQADFFARWELDLVGLEVRSELTPRTIVSYLPDGNRRESSALGDEHFTSMAPRLSNLVDTGAQFSGLYVFRESTAPGWLDLSTFRGATGCAVLWELSALDRGPGGWGRIKNLLSGVDIVWLNVDEGEALLGSRNPAVIGGCLLGHGARVVILRAGSSGSYVADSSGLLHITPAPVSILVDPTGAGNAFSGAFLGAWIASGSIEHAGRTASAAASFIMEQFGPPPAPSDAPQFASRVAASRVERLELGA
jgi:sugar/nucleoside kinase (ribokinase family)